MYDRTYQDRALTFEASGGLINSTLVMQDRETDSYWPIMAGRSIAGEFQGQSLKEIAVNEKMPWKEWRRLHPKTLVLSIDGVEDIEEQYEGYFQSDEGYRGAKAADTRLDTKTPVFAFRLNNRLYAVAHDSLVGGKQFKLGGENVFLYRSNTDGLHDSTKAFLGQTDNCEFSPLTESFEGAQCPQPLIGFDTYWYNWSLNNPDTELLD